MTEDEIKYYFTKSTNKDKVFNSLYQEFIKDWRGALARVHEKKTSDERDFFVNMFSMGMLSGDLPADAISYLAIGLLNNSSEAAQVLGVAFSKGKEQKPEIYKNSFQVALRVVIGNNMSLSNVSENVYLAISEELGKELETVKKYYSDNLSLLQKFHNDGVGFDSLLLHVEGKMAIKNLSQEQIKQCIRDARKVIVKYR